MVGWLHTRQFERDGRCCKGSGDGQILVLFALMLVVLVAMTALAVDGGYAYAQRRRMQYAADAAALAGARVLALGESTAVADGVIRQYARENGADTVTWELVDGNRVRVHVAHTFPTFFARVVGLNAMTAAAQAEALFGGAYRTDNLLPIAVEEFPFELGQTYTLWDAEDRPSPGNFRWLDWDGGSASARELADNICQPENSGSWSVGSEVPGAQGVKVSREVQDCVEAWVGRVVKLIVYDQVTGAGHNARYRIAGFACFRLTDFSLTGRRKFIEGQFVPCVTAGDPGGPDYGMRVVRLGTSQF